MRTNFEKNPFFNLPFYNEYVSNVDFVLLEEPGKEHYQLLSYLSTLFNHQNIFDIGTNQGHSAYALAYNENNNVLTFDIVNHVSNQRIMECGNIKFNLCDLFNVETRQTWATTLLESPLIFLDVDPHNGKMEMEMYQFLLANNYQGLLICDDIWYFKEMRDNFWYQVPIQYKYDLTLYGHWSGTGAITFSDKYVDMLPPKTNTDDWTLVTAYFDLTQNDDMNLSVRPKIYYMNSSQATLSCPYNLVVYCDQGSLQQIKKLRPSYLESKTQYIVLNFDELKFTGHSGYEDVNFQTYRNRVTQNRKEKPYQFDPRNNSSYYLFCMSRYLLLKRTIDNNPFNSTHFAWINICIERMGFKNLIHLDEALSLHRNKFSTLYIDYLPRSFVEKTHEYFRQGYCSMCSGFFTGNSKYMYQTCHAIEGQFLEYLEQGYGHADEQLYSPVYFKNPKLFEHYYGDYGEMIINYCYVYENPHGPLYRFIKNSFENKFYSKCFDSCQFLWNSYINHKCILNHDQINQLLYYKNYSELYLKNTQPIEDVCLSQEKQKQSTIVSLLYDVGIPDHVDKYFEQAHQLLKLTFPMIIWTDDTYYERLKTLFQSQSNVIIYKRNIEQFDQYKYHDIISYLHNTYRVLNRCIRKDTVKYHLLMYERPSMWVESIEKNPFNTETFICMDFGLTRFTKDIKVIEKWNIKNKVKMLMINPYTMKDPQPVDYFHMTRHNIAGGLVTGRGKEIIEYAKLFDQELSLMISNQWCQLDEALTACITRKYPNKFDYLYGDYCGIITNYEKIRDPTNVGAILDKYLNYQMYDKAQAIIDNIDYHYNDETRYLFVNYSIVTNYYAMNQRLNPIVKQILNDPKYQSLNTSIMSKHVSNLKFYKD